MKGVRFRDDLGEHGGFEGKCDYCHGWWPLDKDSWSPRSGMRRCRACWREYKRLKEQGRSTIEAVHELKLMNGRIAYRLNREERLAYNRAWKAANRDKIAAYNRAYRDRLKAA